MGPHIFILVILPEHDVEEQTDDQQGHGTVGHEGPSAQVPPSAVFGFAMRLEVRVDRKQGSNEGEKNGEVT